MARAAARKGKAGASASGGHWVTIHEPDGGYHHVFLPGPRRAGGQGKPNRARERDAARRAGFIGGERDRETESLIRKSHKLREAREAHNEGVKARRMGEHVSRRVHAKQMGFREAVKAHRDMKGVKATPAPRPAGRAAAMAKQGAAHERSRAEHEALVKEVRSTPPDVARKVAQARAARVAGYEGKGKPKPAPAAPEGVHPAKVRETLTKLHGGEIDDRGNSIQGVAKRLGVKPEELTPTLDRLKRQGVVEYDYDSEDTARLQAGAQHVHRDPDNGRPTVVFRVMRPAKFEAAVASHAPAAPARPSLREQAAAHRAAKGDRRERARIVVERLSVRANNLDAKATKFADAEHSAKKRAYEASRSRSYALRQKLRAEGKTQEQHAAEILARGRAKGEKAGPLFLAAGNARSRAEKVALAAEMSNPFPTRDNYQYLARKAAQTASRGSFARKVAAAERKKDRDYQRMMRAIKSQRAQ